MFIKDECGEKWKVSKEKTEKWLKWDDLWTKIRETEPSPAQGRKVNNRFQVYSE